MHFNSLPDKTSSTKDLFSHPRPRLIFSANNFLIKLSVATKHLACSLNQFPPRVNFDKTWNGMVFCAGLEEMLAASGLEAEVKFDCTVLPAQPLSCSIACQAD
ncbi:hypothetical protein BpHYR1_029664 [Brachionus plicatilis]|uniref:Uncharacterized protein n=1 Tax=Brachionus plicatilis TaxID=10195 RepID=A0A3M7QX81_BRAPC|nr:hypothetical protein BpHYR1_029664 [Brachionus plicatilis]